MLLDTTTTERINVPGGGWYEIRTQLGFYDYLIGKYATTSVADAQDASKMKEKEYGKLEAEWELRRFELFLTAWNDPAPLTIENLKRIPPMHADIILAKISEVLDRLEKSDLFREEPATE